MKKYMLLLPSAIYPYIFVSSALLDRRWGTMIFNRILPIIFIAGLLCNIIVMTKAIREKWDARELLQVNRILKWVQLPGNLLFFLYYFIAIFLLSQIISLSKGGDPGSFKSLIEGLGIAFLWIVIFWLLLMCLQHRFYTVEERGNGQRAGCRGVVCSLLTEWKKGKIVKQERNRMENKDTKKIGKVKKGRKRVFLWLLLIPLQLVVDKLLIETGIAMDLKRASQSVYTEGHPAPGITIIFLMIAVVMTAFVVTAVIVIICVRLNHISKKEGKAEFKKPAAKKIPVVLAVIFSVIIGTFLLTGFIFFLSLISQHLRY